MSRLSRWTFAIVGAVVFACGAPTPALAQAFEPPLPKACWDPAKLVGKDTLFVFTPCRDLRVLHPEFRARLECVLDRMLQHGGWQIGGIPSTMIVETKRSRARQQALYGSGRPHVKPYGRPGPIVTNAKSELESAHGTGKAADLAHRKDGWSNQRFFDSLENHAYSCGLDSGNGWVRLKDGPHIQSRGWRNAA